MARKKRLTPREINPSWPEPIQGIGSPHELASERARKIASELLECIESSGCTRRAWAAEHGVDHTTISRLVNGESWPDIYTVTILEEAVKGSF